MINGEKGSTNVAAGLLVVLAFVGLIWWWYDRTPTDLPNNAGQPAATTTDYTFVIEPSATTTAVAEPKPKPSTVAQKPRISYPTVARASSAVSGFHYRNTTFGLTLPLPNTWNEYRVYETAGSPAGFPSTRTIHFIAPGESGDTFLIHVFTKAEWNALRTDENRRGISNMGEGKYLGENATWIYSYNIFARQNESQTILNNARFY